MGGAVYSLPEGFDLKLFLRLIVLFTLVAETAGVIALHLFVFGPADTPDTLWLAIFHSVSAFCTAGFALFNDSFESFRGHLWLNAIVIVLRFLGATGFIVINDVRYALAHRAARITLTTKIILVSPYAISLVGTALMFFEESALQALPPGYSNASLHSGPSGLAAVSPALSHHGAKPSSSF